MHRRELMKADIMKMTKRKGTKMWSVGVALVIAVIALTGCSVMNSKVVTADEFKNAMKEQSLEVKDLTKPENAKVAYEAVASDYRFEYVEMSDSNAAKSYYDSLVDAEKAKHQNGKRVNGNMNDNYEFTCEDGDEYFKSVKKDSTVLTVSSTSADAKTKVNDILKDLGY